MKKLMYLFLLSFLCIGMIQAKEPISFTIATYNLRNANHGDSINGNGWGQRYPYIAKMALFHGFDIFGTQEGLYGQLQDLKSMLPNYEYIGVARDDGKMKGEHSAIFYRTDKFKLLDHGDFWLSEDQTKPNLGWDAVCIRICTWGKFEDIKSGFTFVYFNLHMDHMGVIARVESAKLILKKIQELPKGISVILSGDFNVDQNSPSYKLLNTSGILRDSYEMADLVYAPNGTFNNFNPESKTNSRIDHIFLTTNFSVIKYGVLTDTYRSEINKKTDVDSNDSQKKESQARCPSDHFPVMITVECK